MKPLIDRIKAELARDYLGNYTGQVAVYKLEGFLKNFILIPKDQKPACPECGKPLKVMVIHPKGSTQVIFADDKGKQQISLEFSVLTACCKKWIVFKYTLSEVLGSEESAEECKECGIALRNK